MRDILLTIVIPYKNTDIDKFRSLCLSICNSTRQKDVELLFVNDKSDKQKNKEYLEMLSEVFDGTDFLVTKINVPETNPGGILQGRLLGFINAQGEYVWGIDSDDELYPNSINILTNYIEKTECDIITWRLPEGSRESKYVNNNEDDWNVVDLDNYDSQYNFFINRKILGYTHCKAVRKSVAVNSAVDLRNLGYVNLAEDQIFSSYWFKDIKNGTLMIPERLYNYLEPDCSGKLVNTEPKFQIANYNNVKNTREAFKTFYHDYSDDLLVNLTKYDIYRPQILYSISRVPSKELCSDLFDILLDDFGYDLLKEYSEKNGEIFSNFI